MESNLWKIVKTAFGSVIDAEPGERADLLSELAPDVRYEVERLLAANSAAGEFIAKPFLIEQGTVEANGSSPDIGSKIDEYTILSSLGSGGMGTVYLAENVGDGFSQRVALKLIKSGMDTDLVLRRFLVERQILSSLDHRNIARMLDGGSTPDGLPYFVMEYVDGSPLRVYCDDRSLTTRSRVALFAKVCDAVSYAHQKLVVHRDLKPSNILVDDKGEPKLLDFGIAKLLTPDWQNDPEALTATQFRILTPEYSSPEQLRGEATSTLTDVYSLGVVLYELLTGIRPFQNESQNPAALAEVIRTKEPLKPSIAALFATTRATQDEKATSPGSDPRTAIAGTHAGTRRTVPDPHSLRGDIDNIVLKAIRPEPEKRYQSVRDLLEDIERYLGGLPVKATGDTISYRFNKFVRRHRAGVAIAGISAALMAGAAGFSTYQYSQANRERARAEARFSEVRQFANSILFDHYERIKDLPGSTEAKAKLVSEAVAYLNSVSADAGEDPEFLRELVKAYSKLAEIQGVTTGTGDLGDIASARRNFERAIEIQEKLSSLDPRNIDDARQLSSLLGNYGYVSNLEPRQKAEYRARSFAIMERLRNENPNKEQAESDYARVLWDRANDVRRLGDNAGAIRSFTEAVSIYESLFASTGTKRFRRSAALTYKNLGSVYRVSGDPAAALANYQKAHRYDAEIAAESPDNLESRLGLSFSHRGIGEALTALGRHDEAIASFDSAIKIQEGIHTSDPSNAFAADNLFESYVGLAIALREGGRVDESEGYFKKAFGIETETKRDKTDYFRLQAIAKAHLEYAQLLRTKGTGSRGLVKQELDRAIEAFESVQAANAVDPAYAADFEKARSLRGTI